jgi:hypothetical protein
VVVQRRPKVKIFAAFLALERRLPMLFSMLLQILTIFEVLPAEGALNRFFFFLLYCADLRMEFSTLGRGEVLPTPFAQVGLSALMGYSFVIRHFSLSWESFSANIAAKFPS